MAVMDLGLVRGKDGAQGPQGEPGKDGKDGATGPQGEPGKDGVDGKDGVNGKDGKDGADGAPGPAGYTPVRGVNYWTAADVATIQAYIDEQLGVIANGAY